MILEAVSSKHAILHFPSGKIDLDWPPLVQSIYEMEATAYGRPIFDDVDDPLEFVHLVADHYHRKAVEYRRLSDNLARIVKRLER